MPGLAQHASTEFPVLDRDLSSVKVTAVWAECGGQRVRALLNSSTLESCISTALAKRAGLAIGQRVPPAEADAVFLGSRALGAKGSSAARLAPGALRESGGVVVAGVTWSAERLLVIASASDHAVQGRQGDVLVFSQEAELVLGLDWLLDVGCVIDFGHAPVPRVGVRTPREGRNARLNTRSNLPMLAGHRLTENGVSLGRMMTNTEGTEGIELVFRNRRTPGLVDQQELATQYVTVLKPTLRGQAPGAQEMSLADFMMAVTGSVRLTVSTFLSLGMVIDYDYVKEDGIGSEATVLGWADMITAEEDDATALASRMQKMDTRGRTPCAYNKCPLNLPGAVLGAAGATKRCSACRNAFYCSARCQQMDWPTHKVECRKVSSALTGEQISTLEKLRKKFNKVADMVDTLVQFGVYLKAVELDLQAEQLAAAGSSGSKLDAWVALCVLKVGADGRVAAALKRTLKAIEEDHPLLPEEERRRSGRHGGEAPPDLRLFEGWKDDRSPFHLAFVRLRDLPDLDGMRGLVTSVLNHQKGKLRSTAVIYVCPGNAKAILRQHASSVEVNGKHVQQRPEFSREFALKLLQGRVVTHVPRLVELEERSAAQSQITFEDWGLALLRATEAP
mmetsp:Transcript_18163/g.59341  ORF Transcript_18163/g.59341 Transcript_18163/m.59341 type:complete len:620 (+) Transcript_18163:32-1891(+)